MSTEQLPNLSEIPAWSLVDTAGGQSLRREFKFASFTEAIRFMADAAPQIDRLDHHPDWENRYRTVDVRTTTHDAGNRVTEKDVRLAMLLDGVYASGFGGAAV